MHTVFEKDDPALVELRPAALAIDEALVSLHDALKAAQRQGCDLQFLVDAAPPVPGPSDPGGFFSWDNNDPDSAMAQPFAHSYAVTAVVTNSVPNQVHPITVSVSCVDSNGSGACRVNTGLSNLEVNIYTP